MTIDPNVADPVKLAAIEDALDRSGLAAKNAVSVEVGLSKPFEAVFDSIVSGPRPNPAAHHALAELESPGESDVIVGEYDDDPLPEEEEIKDCGYTDSDLSVIDVEVMEDDPGPLTPPHSDSALSGPPGRGLMTLEQANEAAAEMRRRANIRDMRRR
jgi:hypothetical protein